MCSEVRECKGCTSHEMNFDGHAEPYVNKCSCMHRTKKGSTFYARFICSQFYKGCTAGASTDDVVDQK